MNLFKTLVLLFSFSAFANFNFADLSRSDLDSMSKEIGANFSHSTVTPGAPMGNIFGFQVGLVAGVTSSAELERLAKREDPTTDLEYVPTAGVMGVLTVPFGITVEATVLPSLDTDNADLSNISGAVRWSFFNAAIVDFAIRGHFSSGEMSYTDTVESISSEITIKHSTMGAHLIATADLPFIKPYAGVGFISHDTDWSINTTASLFNFTSADNANSSESSAHLIAGVEANLLLFNLGVEYSSMFDTHRYMTKLSIGF